MIEQPDWYQITNVAEIDSPALVVYPERVKQNIRLLKSRVKDVVALRPHIKTNKMAEVCQLMMAEGIQKFKCATIAEAEMLAMVKAPDVLLAYQPVGPKVLRLLQLIKTYPSTQFSCLVDNIQHADSLNWQSAIEDIQLNVFIDLNVGMNRTGIAPCKALNLFSHCAHLSNLSPRGLHGYDGHVNDTDSKLRQEKSDKEFAHLQALADEISSEFNFQPIIVAGGSPSFVTHALRENVECSPGTFVFWDWGYKQKLPDEPYDFAALVISRVISVINEHTICTDLGHKSVAAENPLPRVHFLNAPDANPIGQSEEHLVLEVPDAAKYSVGDVFYGVPVHICPTVALYERAIVIENNNAVGEWKVVARDRKITI
ncbi:MAG: family PLP-dependent enzyme [Segetibacter sp.]|nr:family PLP-dependent enzyme [Segetibacter sp.]